MRLVRPLGYRDFEGGIGRGALGEGVRGAENASFGVGEVLICVDGVVLRHRAAGRRCLPAGSGRRMSCGSAARG